MILIQKNTIEETPATGVSFKYPRLAPWRSNEIGGTFTFAGLGKWVGTMRFLEDLFAILLIS
jgi:hypothetical protein